MLLNQQNILKDIIISIYDSNLIIADLTGLNSNVFYELGLAHALRKNVILLTQEIDELPFDLRSYRVIQYSTHFTKIRELEDNLKRLTKEIKAGKLSFGSPVTDWLPIEKLDQETFIEKSPEIEQQIQEQDADDIDAVDKGLLDYLADLDESMTNLTELITDFGVKTEELGKVVEEQTDVINKATTNPSAGTFSYIRKIARKISNKMNDYGQQLSKQNKEYEKQWNLIEDSTINLVTNPRLSSDPEELSGFLTFLDTMESVKESIVSAKDGIHTMGSGIASVKGFESSVTRASILVEREISIFVGLLDRSISTLERAVMIGRKQIENNVNRKNVDIV